MAVADSHQEDAPAGADIVSVDSSDEEADELWIAWEDLLPISWHVQCLHGRFKIPGEFMVELIHWICAAERLGDRVRDVSDVELTFALLTDQDIRFPFSIDGSQQLSMRKPAELFQKPTFVQMLRPVQHALAHVQSLFPAVIRTQPRARPDLGLYMKFSGVRIRIPHQIWSDARILLHGFTANRAVRRLVDLSRPAR